MIKLQIKIEGHGRYGVVILWEQALPPSKRTEWTVQIGSTRKTYSDYLAAHSAYTRGIMA